MTAAGIWLSALLTLAAFSFVFKENPAFRLAEHLFVGVSAGNSLVVGLRSVNSLAVAKITSSKQPLDSRMIAVFGIVMGLLLFARFFKSIKSLRALPVGILLGTGTGTALSGTIVSNGVAQIKATLLPLNSIDNWVIIIGCLTTMIYFFYSAPKSRFVQRTSVIGRYMIMVGFGASYGNTVMSRITLLADRMQFLLKDWLHLVK